VLHDVLGGVHGDVVTDGDVTGRGVARALTSRGLSTGGSVSRNELFVTNSVCNEIAM